MASTGLESGFNSSLGSKSDSCDSSQGLSLISSPTALKKLRKKKYLSEWNNSTARHVYGAFRIKRHHVDLNHILCPTLRKPSDYQLYTLVPNGNKSWEHFCKCIQGFLDVFDEDAYCIGEGPKNPEALKAARRMIKKHSRNMINPEKSSEPLNNMLNSFINTEVGNLKYILRCDKKKTCLSETFFQHHVETLLNVFHFVDFDITLGPYFEEEPYEFTVDDHKHTYKPKPDIFLLDGMRKIVAVIEVKSSNKGMNQGHGDQPDATMQTDKSEFISTSLQVPSLPDGGPPPVKKAKLVDVLDDNQPPASGPTSDSSTSPYNSESDTHSNNSDDVEFESDIFDKEECAIEVAKKADLPTFVRTLDFQEKRSVRCVLPQLFAEMLAYSHHEKNGFFPNILYENFRLGLAVTNFKVRFVTLVIKDNGKKIEMPTAADIQKDINVRPYIYVTDELNLFKKEDLTEFFRVLFTISEQSASY